MYYAHVMDAVDSIVKKVSDVAAASSQKVREFAEQIHRQHANASTINISQNSSVNELRAKLAKLAADHPQCSETNQCALLGLLYQLDDGENLIRDIESRLWFTYRRGFTPITGNNGLTCDTGWGCMIRCGQMMVAQALILMLLGRDWRWKGAGLRFSPGDDSMLNSCDAEQSGDGSSIDDTLQHDDAACVNITNDDLERETDEYYEILARFIDNKNCCYSVHKIALQGEQEGKRCGDWFGPNTIAQVMRKLSHLDQQSGNCKYSINICLDGILCTTDVKQDSRRTVEAREKHDINDTTTKPPSESSTSKWCPLILIIPLRLGLHELNVGYIEALKQSLAVRNSLGILGGRPDHALWFIGYAGDEVLYLDPHTTQPSASFDDVISHTTPFKDIANIIRSQGDEYSFHSQQFHSMHFNHIDPSIALGFYCETEIDFDRLCETFQQHVLPLSKPALFEIYKTLPEEWRTTPASVGTASVSNNNERYKRSTSNSGGGETHAGDGMTVDSDISSATGDDEFEILA